MYGVVFSQTNIIFLFLLVYFVVNSYKVYLFVRHLNPRGLSLQKSRSNITEGRPKVSERGDQGSLSQTCARGFQIRRTSRLLKAGDGGGSFATSSSHSAENPPACS